MALPQNNQLLVTISSNRGWTRSPRGLLQQPGSSPWPWDTTPGAHLCHPQETLLCSVISSVTFRLMDMLLDPASSQQLSRARVRRQREFFSSKMAMTAGRLKTWSPHPLTWCWHRTLILTLWQGAGWLPVCTLGSRCASWLPVPPPAPSQSRCHVPALHNIRGNGVWATPHQSREHGLSAGKLAATHCLPCPLTSEDCSQRTRLQLWPSPFREQRNEELGLQLYSLRPSLTRALVSHEIL